MAPKKEQFNIRLSKEDKGRIQAYLKATYDGTMAEFLRRIAFEKVSAWEERQREERRKEEEHQAKLAQMGVAS